MKESVGFGVVVVGSVVMRSVVRRVLWRRWLGSAWGARVLDDDDAGLGVNAAPARGWSGPQRRAAGRLRPQLLRLPPATSLSGPLWGRAGANAAAARAAKVGPITAK